METEDESVANGAPNKTFLGVDAILYPKDSKVQLNVKKPRKTKFHSSSNYQDLAKVDSRLMNLDGLKGYGKAASRVSTIMNEMAQNNLAKQLE